MKRLSAERLEEIRSKARREDVCLLIHEIDALRTEVEEQCRLNGMGAQRELKLITERDALRSECQTHIRKVQLEIGKRTLLSLERDRLRGLLDEAVSALNVLGSPPHKELPGETIQKALAKIEAGLK